MNRIVVLGVTVLASVFGTTALAIGQSDFPANTPIAGFTQVNQLLLDDGSFAASGCYAALDPITMREEPSKRMRFPVSSALSLGCDTSLQFQSVYYRVEAINTDWDTVAHDAYTAKYDPAQNPNGTKVLSSFSLPCHEVVPGGSGRMGRLYVFAKITAIDTDGQRWTTSYLADAEASTLSTETRLACPARKS